MNRLLFKKEDDGIWISHLDLMRLFQRAFRRAGVAIRHTNGFNPHDYVSIAMPLSVGTESVCELLEFTPEQAQRLDDLPERLNATLPAGIRVLEAYDSPRPLKELHWLRAQLTLEYDHGVPTGAAEQITALLEGPTLPVEKRGKKGTVETDIRPLLHSAAVRSGTEDGALLIEAVVHAQNPALNPDLIRAAMERHLPALRPDFCRSRRMEVLDASFAPFR